MRERADARPGLWGAALASGLLLTLAQPPFRLLVPSFVALTPFALGLAALSRGAPGRALAARGGAVLGLAHHGTALFWMVPALGWVAGWGGVPVFVVVLVVLAGITALFGWALHRAVHDVGAPLWLALPVAWTAAEWIQAHLPGGLAFPWLGLGTSLATFPRLAGAAELAGARGLTFWLALTSGWLATALLRHGARRARAVAVLTAVVLVPVGWSLWRAATLEMRPALRVAVVQTGIPAGTKLDAGAWEARTLEALDGLLDDVTGERAELVALPEGLLPMDAQARETAARPGLGALRRWAARLDAPLLFGGYGFGPAAGTADVPVPGTRNAAFLMRPDGRVPYRYDKRRLVPLVEWDPLPGAGVLERVLERGGAPPPFLRPDLGSFVAGRTAPLASVGSTDVGLLICFESIFPESARALRRGGAELLVNLSNDAWLGTGRRADDGDGPGVAARAALAQHPAHLVLRAIEGRVGAARAANGGTSMLVDPTGRVHAVRSAPEPGVAVGEVRTSDIVTLYTRTGDLLGPGCVMATLLLLAAAARSRNTAVFRGSLDPQAPQV